MPQNSAEEMLFSFRLSQEKEPIDEAEVRRVFSLAWGYAQGSLKAKSPEKAVYGDMTLLDYVIGEIRYARKNPDEDQTDERVARKAYQKYLLLFEEEEEDAEGLPYYSAEVSTLLALGQLLERINRPTSKKNPEITLVNDLFDTVFRKVNGFAGLLTLGQYADGFTMWRTFHESECILKLLIDGGEPIRQAYVLHLSYNNYLQNQQNFTPAFLDEKFVAIKAGIKEHGLAAKDMKKYIEYGWIYSSPAYDPKDTSFRLNFLDGVEKLAGLSRYRRIYQGSSEITHSSSMFFYVNNEFCKKLALTLVYSSFGRIADLYLSYMKNYFDANPEKAKEVDDLLQEVKRMAGRFETQLNLEELSDDEKDHDRPL